jgi:CHRD domain
MHLKQQRGRMRLRFGMVLAVTALGAALAAPAFVMGGDRAELESRMTGGQVVPHGTGSPGGVGHAEFKVRLQKRKLCFETTFRRTGGPVRGYIFRGRAGEAPPKPQHPTVTLFGSLESSPEAGCVSGVKKERLRRLRNEPRAFHVVLVNDRYENGAIRGQLRR